MLAVCCFFTYYDSVLRVKYVRYKPSPKNNGTGAACRNEETHPIKGLNKKKSVNGTIAIINIISPSAFN